MPEHLAASISFCYQRQINLRFTSLIADKNLPLQCLQAWTFDFFSRILIILFMSAAAKEEEKSSNFQWNVKQWLPFPFKIYYLCSLVCIIRIIKMAATANMAVTQSVLQLIHMQCEGTFITAPQALTLTKTSISWSFFNIRSQFETQSLKVVSKIHWKQGLLRFLVNMNSDLPCSRSYCK